MFEKFKDFRDTLSERIRSPFIGSLIITWCFIHWRVLLLLFYHEDGLTLDERIHIIGHYVDDYGILGMFIKPVIITLIVLLLYNVLSAIGLSIKLLYDNWVSPQIQKWLYNKNIIEKPKYEKLKREYSVLKNEFDSERQKQLDGEDRFKDLQQSFDNYKNNSIEGRITGNISEVFESGDYWLLKSKYPDGKIEELKFQSKSNGFHLEGNKVISLNRMKISTDGRFVSFNKVVNGQEIKCRLVKDYFGNLSGVENNNVLVEYNKVDPRIRIVSAKYLCKDNYIDVKPIIDEQLERGIHVIEVNNSSMRGDPYFGQKKTLVLVVEKDGKAQQIMVDENSKINLYNYEITV